MRAFFAWMLGVGAVACAASKPAHGPHEGQNRTRASEEIEVPRTVITPHADASIPELMHAAAALAAAQRWADAALAYDRVHRLDDEGRTGTDALWGAADAHDRAHNLEAALIRYQQVNAREADTLRGRDALVRATRIAVFLGRFELAGTHAERLLKVVDQLNDGERIAVFSARALALLERGDDQQASYFIEKGRDIVESRRLDAAGRIPRDLAQLYYALGESRRIKAERILFQPMPPNFAVLLEARCQLLLDAQSAYSDSMRAYDAHWSAMAGFRTAELYQKLHQDLLAVEPPANADTERKRQLFEGAVRTRFAILLSKAKGMAEHTLAMAERTRESSEWVERTRAALRSIDEAIQAEEAALAKLPYTKGDFEAYFAQMEAKASAAAPKAPASGPAPHLQK